MSGCRLLAAGLQTVCMADELRGLSELANRITGLTDLAVAEGGNHPIHDLARLGGRVPLNSLVKLIAMDAQVPVNNLPKPGRAVPYGRNFAVPKGFEQQPRSSIQKQITIRRRRHRDAAFVQPSGRLQYDPEEETTGILCQGNPVALVEMVPDEAQDRIPNFLWGFLPPRGANLD